MCSSLVTSSACQISSAWRRPCSKTFPGWRVVYYWRGNGKAKREWASHWHGPATIIGLQHESLWWAHRTTTVRCCRGHVQHATASEQLPLGPMHHALRVTGGRLVVISNSLTMCLWTSTGHRRDAHVTRQAGTQPSDFIKPSEFGQRAQTAGVPLPRTSDTAVPAPETPF